jgi:23S rRNA (pseudouridine1915-N3)-methyltransferase
MRIRVIWEGKTKDPNLRALVVEYKKRISHFCNIAIEEISPLREGSRGSSKALTPAEKRLLEKLSGSTRIFLDERGRQWSSEEFARWLGGEALRGTRDLAFLVGGPDGFSELLRQKSDGALALSKMTLIHDWARALLLEQIYRGFTILRGFPYAR